MNWTRLKLELQRLGDRLDHQRLGEPGNADEEGMPAREDGRQDAVHDRILTDDPLGDLGPE